LSPELETLDQLQGGGDLSLEVIVKLFPSFDDFRRGVLGLLSSGDVALIAQNGIEVPTWRWQQLFGQQRASELMSELHLKLTPQGSKRIR